MLIVGDRTNSDIVQKLRSQLNQQINSFIDTIFAGNPDPPLSDVLYVIRNSNFSNMYKSGTFFPKKDDGKIDPIKTRGQFHRFGQFAGHKRRLSHSSARAANYNQTGRS